MLQVNGGPAHSGKRRVKVLSRWFCRCEGPDGMLIRPGTMYSCPGCGARRP